MEAFTEITLEGFQVVSSDYFTNFSRPNMPTLTIWDGSIGFTKQDIVMLNSCESIIVEINIKSRRILIAPTNSSDKDAINWIKCKNPIKAKKINCNKLTDELYKSWEWNKNLVYRAKGKLVTCANKVMLLFDFNDVENWMRPDTKNVK